MDPPHIPLEEDKEDLNVDELMGKFSFGRYYFFTTFILSLGLMSEGIEISLLSILNVIYKAKFGYSEMQISLLVSSIFVGMLIGTVSSGYLSDRFGRKRCIYVSDICLFFPSIISALVTNVYGVFFLRAIAVLFTGISSPVRYTYMAELYQKEIRGKLICLLAGSFSVGLVLTNFVAFLLADYVENINWRILITVMSFPMLISGIINYFYIEESARHTLLLRHDELEFRNIIQRIQEKNHQEGLISNEDLVKVENWAKTVKEDNNLGNWKILFQKKYIKATLIINLMWFVSVYLYYTIAFLAPMFTSSKHRKTSTLNLLLNSFTEIIAIFFAMVIVDRSSLLRKNSILLQWGVSGLGFIFMGFAFQKANIGIGLWITFSIVRLLVTSAFDMIEVVTSESFDTNARASAESFCHCFCRIAGILMPIINSSIIKHFGDSVLFFFLAFIAFFPISFVWIFLVEKGKQNIH